MSVYRAELYFSVAAIIILVLIYFSSLSLPAADRDEALLVCCGGLLFWTASVRAISLMMQGLAKTLSQETQASGAGSRKFITGGILKVVAISFLIVMINNISAKEARWFVMATLGYIFLGCLLLIFDSVLFSQKPQACQG